MTPSDFPAFADAVRDRFETMKSGRLFTVTIDRDKIWETYLQAFPDGTNPIFRKRTEHDCSCCRSFIRAVGNVIAIQNGKIATIWEIENLPQPYKTVAAALDAYVRSRPVENVFLTTLNSAGQPESVELLEDGKTITWEHFSVDIPKTFHSRDPGLILSRNRAAFDVLQRGVEEIDPQAVETVLSLIEENNLYRGQEFKERLVEFQRLQNALRGGNPLLVWEACNSPVAKLRNEVIGTLLQDLSSGKDVEQAVRAYESKVAPTNYKRPTAVVTKAMAENAMKTIQELDLEPALQRRHARLTDVSVTSVLWVDGSVQNKLKGGLEAVLMESVAAPAFDAKKAKPISIKDFLAMQHKKGIQLYLADELVPNLVSMTAPVHPEVKSLFQWSNDFAWSYNGNVTDSIKEKVKRAGGMVEGVALRCSLAWFNYDDLDLHCTTPRGMQVSFRNKMGILDVDMNAGGPGSREAVENMRWVTPENGLYQFFVHNFNRRETIDVGFVIEVESELGVQTFRHPAALPNAKWVTVCTVRVANGRVVEVLPSVSMQVGGISREIWGLSTQKFSKVNAIVQSPNYWDGNAVGNEHVFFILEGCKNPEPCRGIYNEFLHPRLIQHRKVFELVGNKTKCPVADEQLSGVGISSTRKDQVYLTSNGQLYAVSF